MNLAASRAGATPRPLALRWFDAKWIVIGACIALVVYLALVPLGFLAWHSIRAPDANGAAGGFTLGNFRAAYASPDTPRLFGNSLRFAVGASLLSFVMGTLLAWIHARTHAPLRRLFFALSLVPLIVPGVLFAIAWILLGSPKIGLVNLALQRLFATDAVFVNVYSLAGMVWVEGLHHAPIAFLLIEIFGAQAR